MFLILLANNVLKQGPCTLIQSIVPHALNHTRAATAAENARFRHESSEALQKAVDAFCDAIESVPGVFVISKPKGAMYILLLLDIEKVGTAGHFCRGLVDKCNLLILPGDCFALPNSVRVSVGPPPLMVDAANRIKRYVSTL